MKLDALTGAVLDQLDDQRPPGFVEASIAMLAMSNESRRELTKNLLRITKLTRTDGTFHDLTLSFVPTDGWGVTFITSPRAREDELPNRLATYVVLKKHQLGADRWIGFGIIAGAKGAFHALVADYAPWRPDGELDAMVAGFFALQPPLDQLSPKLRSHLERTEPDDEDHVVRG